MAREHLEEDLIAGDSRTLIPEAKYSAQCIEAKKSMVGMETTKGTFARTPKVVLKFRIIDGEYQDEEVPMYLNADYRPIPPGSKLYRCWAIAKGCKPARRDRMSLDVFKGHIFTVSVTTVKPKFKDGTGMPQQFWYSRVDEIYDKQA